jgi:hypothetical protein
MVTVGAAACAAAEASKSTSNDSRETWARSALVKPKQDFILLFCRCTQWLRGAGPKLE